MEIKQNAKKKLDHLKKNPLPEPKIYIKTWSNTSGWGNWAVLWVEGERGGQVGGRGGVLKKTDSPKKGNQLKSLLSQPPKTLSIFFFFLKERTAPSKKEKIKPLKIISKLKKETPCD